MDVEDSYALLTFAEKAIIFWFSKKKIILGIESKKKNSIYLKYTFYTATKLSLLTDNALLKNEIR